MPDSPHPSTFLHSRNARSLPVGWIVVPALVVLIGLPKATTPTHVIALFSLGLGVTCALLLVRTIVLQLRKPYTSELAALANEIEPLLDRSTRLPPAVKSPRATTPPIRRRLPARSTLADLLGLLREEHAELAAAQHVGLDFRMHGDLDHAPLELETIRFVLAHLIDNAIRHGHDAVTPGLVELRANPIDDGKAVRFTVSDDGHGVSPASRASLFGEMPSTRRPAPSLKKPGLMRCRELAEAVQGTIACEPRTPRGTRFVFDIPVKVGRPQFLVT